MNLNTLFSWKSQDKETENNNSVDTNTFQKESISNPNSSNVIQLDGSFAGTNFNNLSDSTESVSVNQANDYKGLLSSPEMVTFFKHNFYGLGQHNGRKLLSKLDFQAAREALISDFQNQISSLIQQKQNKLNRIKSEIIAIEGFSESTTLRLHTACEHTSLDISELKEQLEKASDGKGWVLDALNRYQIGFNQGMRETLEFRYLIG
jgi:hypothetical protein